MSPRIQCFGFPYFVSTISWFFAGNSTSGIIARSVRALLYHCVQEKAMNNCQVVETSSP